MFATYSKILHQLVDVKCAPEVVISAFTFINNLNQGL